MEARVDLDATERTYYRCPAFPWRALVLQSPNFVWCDRRRHLASLRKQQLQSDPPPDAMIRKARDRWLLPRPRLLRTSVRLSLVPALSLMMMPMMMRPSLGMPMMASPPTPLPPGPLRACPRSTKVASVGAATRLSTNHARASRRPAEFTNADASSEACRGRAPRLPDEHLADATSSVASRLWQNPLCPTEVSWSWKLSSNRIEG